MKKGFILILIIFVSINGFCQKNFSAEILTGFGFNRDLYLVNQEVEAHDIFTAQINTNYKLKLYKHFFTEIGIGAQWYFTSGSVAFSNFKATSLRLNLPFIISYPILEKVSIGTGIIISHNTDLDDIDLRARNILRTSLTLKGYYTLKENLSLLLLFKQNISDTPDLYLLNQPNTDISIGISYKLF